jgi:small-conductance mechanosensitive channel
MCLCVILSVRTYEWSQHLLHSENTSLLNSAVKNMFKLWGGRDISPHVTYSVDKLKRLLHRTNASFAQNATRSTNIAQPASRAGPNTWTSSYFQWRHLHKATSSASVSPHCSIIKRCFFSTMLVKVYNSLLA